MQYLFLLCSTLLALSSTTPVSFDFLWNLLDLNQATFELGPGKFQAVFECGSLRHNRMKFAWLRRACFHESSTLPVLAGWVANVEDGALQTTLWAPRKGCVSDSEVRKDSLPVFTVPVPGQMSSIWM
jgi:hypothetical protein